MAGISSKAAGGIENKYKYNGKELQHKEFSEGSGIELYDFGARMQDPQLGRWNGVDPLSFRMPDISPYVYCFNNPYRYIDVNGMEGNDANGDDEMVHVRYDKNKKTGEITVTQISDEEYNNSTNGGTEHVVSFEKGDGDYVYANNSGSGMFQTKGYHGEKSQTEGENYNYVGHINWGKGGKGEGNSNDKQVAQKDGGNWGNWLKITADVFSAAGIGGTVKNELIDFAVRDYAGLSRQSFNQLSNYSKTASELRALGATGVKYLRISKGLGYFGAGIGVASASYQLIKNPTSGNATRLAVQGAAVGAVFIPVVGWGVSLGISAADLIFGDDFYNWIDKH